MASPQTIPVFYATNRLRRSPSKGPSELSFSSIFGNLKSDGDGELYDHKPGDSLIFGTSNVPLLPNRQPGRPGAGMPQDVKEVTDLHWVGQLKGEEILVFIHGYSNSFTNALQAAAQIKKDLLWSGPIIAFSWPSWGRVEKYSADEVIVENSVKAFSNFLEQIQADVKKINILSHSMGNRLHLQALSYLCDRTQAITLPLGQLIFAAADVDAGTFMDKIQSIIHAGAGQGRTSYLSCLDQALGASSDLHSAIRAGQAWPIRMLVPYEVRRPSVLIKGLDCIDCSDVGILDLSHDSHSYFAQPPVIDDIKQVLLGRSAEERTTDTEEYGTLTRVQPPFDVSNEVVGAVKLVAGPPPDVDINIGWWRVDPKKLNKEKPSTAVASA